MKEEKLYYFSVEGKTEQEYLKWLEKEINKHPEAKYFVKFNIQITNFPTKREKTIPSKENTDVFHFCDIESLDDYHLKFFHQVIDNLVKATKSKKINNYYLGYSNQTFDLWLVLHQMDAFAPNLHRKNYINFINKAFKTNYRGMQEFKRGANLRKLFNKWTLKNVQDAIKRERMIRKNNQNNHFTELTYHGYKYFKENPSLSVGECIDMILKENNLSESEENL